MFLYRGTNSGVSVYIEKYSVFGDATYLYKSCLGRIKTASTINLAHECLLRLAVGCHHPLTFAITV